MEPQDVLRDGAEVVRTRGWGTFQYSDHNQNNVCALGGLRAAAFGTPLARRIAKHPNYKAYVAAWHALGKVMREQLSTAPEGPGLGGVTFLNDHMVKSGEELAEYMEKAASRLDA